jgi:hypothetical protein
MPKPLSEEVRCLGCGHRLREHRRYTHDGTNHRGSPWVCTVDDCTWTVCHFKGDTQKASDGSPS